MLLVRVKALFKKNGRIGMRGKAAERPDRFSFFIFEQEQICHLVVGIIKINRLVENRQLRLIASQKHDVRILGVRPSLFVKGHSRPNRYAAELLHVLLAVKGKFRPHIAFCDITVALLRAVNQLENRLDRAVNQRIHRLAGHLFKFRSGMNLKFSGTTRIFPESLSDGQLHAASAPPRGDRRRSGRTRRSALFPFPIQDKESGRKYPSHRAETGSKVPFVDILAKPHFITESSVFEKAKIFCYFIPKAYHNVFQIMSLFFSSLRMRCVASNSEEMESSWLRVLTIFATYLDKSTTHSHGRSRISCGI